jgi:hypothetical protein
MAFIWSSVRLRLEGHSFAAQEWEAITGLRALRTTSQNVFSCTCETSTTTPSARIAATTSRPKPVSPPGPSPTSPEEAAQGRWTLWVRVM